MLALVQFACCLFELQIVVVVVVVVITVVVIEVVVVVCLIAAAAAAASALEAKVCFLLKERHGHHAGLHFIA